MAAENDTAPARSRFGWLRRNNFYLQTPLNGFSFIQEAKSLPEVCLWYALTVAFSIITVINLYQAIINYLSSPTLTYVRHTASTKDIQLTNLSFVLHASWADFNGYDDPTNWFRRKASHATVAWFEYLRERNQHYIPNFYACYLTQDEDKAYSANFWDLGNTAIREKAHRSIREPWSKFMQIDGHKKPRLVNFANPKLLAGWKKQLNQTSNKLYNLWLNNYRTQVPWPEHVFEVNDILREVVYARPRDLFLKLMLLNALNDNSDPRNHLKQTLSENYEEFSNAQGTFKSNAMEILKSLGSTPTELLDDVLHGLSQTFAFKIINAPGAAVYLRNIRFEMNINLPNTTQLFADDDLALEFQVSLPATTDTMDHIRIELHSFIFKWYMYIIRSFFLYFNHGIYEVAGDNYDDYVMQKLCSRENESVMHRLYGEVDRVEDYYYIFSLGKLDTPNVNPLQLYSREDCKVLTIPIDEFYSNTKGCYNGTYESCIDECENGLYLETCNCYSWKYYFLNINNTNRICDGSCVPLKQKLKYCISKCTQLVRHPCHISKYTLQKSMCSPMNQFDENKPIHVIEYIKPKVFNHPQFFEEYMLTFGSFMNHLGGVFDFWMGLNVIALLHIIVYAFKEIVNTFNRNSKRQAQEQKKNIDTKPKDSLESYMEKYNSKLQSLQEECATIKGKKEGNKKTWLWLRSNDFYVQTPLAGFKFITLSETLAEVVVWYGMIFIFTIITVYNAWAAVTHYNSAPTRSYVVPTASTENITLVNFSIVVEIPLVEYMMLAPIQINEEVAVVRRPSYIPHFYTCFATQPPLTEDYIWDLYDNQKYFWLNKDLAFRQDKLTIGDSENVSSTLRTDLLDYWKTEMQPWADTMKDFMIKNYNKIIFPHNNVHKTGFDFIQGINGIMHHRPQHTFLKLLFLSAIKYGSNITTILEQSKMLAKWKDAPIFGLDDLRHLGATPKQLLVNVLEELNDRIFIQVQHAPGAGVYLNDYQITSRGTQKFTYRILFPRETDEIEISVHSSFAMWFYEILKIIKEYYKFLEQYPTLYEKQNLCEYEHDDYRNSPQSEFDSWTWPYLLQKLHDMVIESMYGDNRLIIESITGQNVPLYTFSRFDLLLTPRFQFLAQVKNCYPATFEICYDDCLNAAYLEACKCYPWTLYYLNMESIDPMCSGPCVSVSESICKEKCSNELSRSCKANLYDLHTHEAPTDTHGSQVLRPIYNFRIRKPKVFNHPQFVEEYSMTLRDLISELGGLLDFWTGMNVIAVIHLAVYLIKQCKHSIDKESKTGKIIRMMFCDSSNAIIKNEKCDTRHNILQRIDQLKKEFDNDTCVYSVVPTHEMQKSQTEKQTFRFTWLRQNTFFAETSLTGYSFIQASRSILEAAFWYCVILTFSIITINGTESVISHYASRPTTNIIKPAASTEQIQMANFSLHIELPVLDIIGQHPMKLLNDKDIEFKNSKWVPQYLACNSGTEYYDKNGEYLLSLIANNIHEQWVKFINEPLEQFRFNSNHNQHQKTIDFSSKSMLKQWRRRMQNSAHDLENFLDRNKNVRISTNMDATVQNIQSIFMKPIQTKNDTALKLMLLHSLTENTDFRKTLFNDIDLPLSEALDVKFEPSENFESSIAELLRRLKITPFDLVSAALTDLSNIIHIDAGPVEMNIKLEKWSFSIFENQNYFIKEWINKYRHMFEIKIELPENVSNVQIEIRSFLLMWHEYVIRTFEKYFLNLKQTHERLYVEQSICDKSADYTTILENQLETLDTFYGEHGIAYLETNRGQMIQVKSNGYHEIILSPISQYSSKIDNCFDGTYEQCVTECDNQAHLSHCQCYPWMFYKLNRNIEAGICSKPCDEAKQELTVCERECQYKNEHACRMSFYNMESNHNLLRNHMLTHELEEPWIVLNVSISDVFIHPQFIEDYAMNLGLFMSGIGGVVDFWLGVNIVGLLHMATYIFRHCSKNKKTIQQDTKRDDEKVKITNVRTFRREFRMKLSDLRKKVREEKFCRR